MNKLLEINIRNYVQGNPYLVVAVGLCSLLVGNNNEFIRKNIESPTTTLKSVLVNVSGNLLMFQPDEESLFSIPENLSQAKPVSKIKFKNKI